MNFRSGVQGDPEARVRIPPPRPTSMQSRRMSLIEAIANILVGYAIAILTQLAVFPMFRLQASLADNLAIGAVFSAVSIARSYVLRRGFEAIRIRSAAGSRHATSDGPCAAG
jgi:hypothetical protein